MFRNPVERLISKFYYLQVATWEVEYNPSWAEMGLVEWAENHNIDNDFYVSVCDSLILSSKQLILLGLRIHGR